MKGDKMELKKYMDDIFELRRYYAHKNLDNLISKKIPDLQKSQKFNIKMEVKRLANISSKTIDLRYVVTDSTSVSFKFDGKTHFLDEKGLELFKSELKIYDGIYTEGVFDRVMKDAKERLKLQKVKQELRTINFTERNPRQEERMNFTVKLNLFVISDQSPVGFKKFIDNPSGKSLTVVSLNISENGLKIKAKKEVKLEEDEVIFVEFQPEQLGGNEKSYHVPYQVIKIYNDRGTQNIAMKRVSAISNYDFERTLRNFIESRKDKYKIELTNIIDSAKAKSYEQAYVENIQSLPLYFSNSKLEYAYSAGKNDKITRYFENEFGKNVLVNVLEDLDVNVPNDETKRTSLYFMMFKLEKKGKIFFFAKSLASQNVELLKLFSMYGARRKTFRIFKLDILKIKEEQYFNKSTLPEEVLKHVNFSNHFLTNEAKNKLSQLTSVGLLTDITDSDYKLNLSQMNSIETNVNELTKYKIDVDSVKEIKIIDDESKEIRKEDRFEFEELVTFKYKRLNFRAKTENISVNGMRIVLERYSPILEGEKLIITFRNLNNEELVNIPYRVVGAFDMTLSLKLLKDETEKCPDDYFENYIRNNINNLKPVGIKTNVIGLSKGLRNIYIHNHLETPCFFKIKNYFHS
jgi:hypothetical protein